MKIDEPLWNEGALVTGVLNFHPESIDVLARVITYHHQRIVLKFEPMSTYARSTLAQILSPERLGRSLQLVTELPHQDLWFHGACNTDVILRVSSKNLVDTAEVFYSNFYTYFSQSTVKTGTFFSEGPLRRDWLIQSIDEVTQSRGVLPTEYDSIQLKLDSSICQEKLNSGKKILANASFDMKMKKQLERLLSGS